MLKYILIVLLIFFGDLAKAQHKTVDIDSVKYGNKIMVIARNYGDSIVLRWSPTNFSMWMALRNSGIDIYRYELDTNSSKLSNEKKLNALPIKPMTLDVMKNNFKPTDTNAAMMAQVLYGKMLVENAQTLESLDKMEADQSNRLLYATYLADLYPELAKAVALGFVDKDIDKGKTYIYQLKSDIKKAMKFDLEESSIMVSTKHRYQKDKLKSIDAIGFDKRIEVFWNRNEGESLYTAYEIERKDGNTTFKKITNKPYTNPNNPADVKDDELIVFKDSVSNNYIPYTYRVRGIDAFGQRGEWSSVTVNGVDLTAPKAPEEVVAVYNPITKAVQISWKKTVKESDLGGYVVGRSANYDGPFTPINDRVYGVNELTAIDLNSASHLRNFYIVSAIDTAGNVGRSVPAYAIIADSIPPLKPTGLMAKIDTLGVVSLSWDLGKELDLSGYNIYRANSEQDAFVVINKAQVLDNKFVDMLDINSLTKTALYKIVAFDKTNNPSEYSAIVKVQKPDYIPPVAPQITKFLIDNNQVQIHFNPSGSADLKEYHVYRKIDSTNVKISTILKTDSVFKDNNLVADKIMWYTLVAVDSAGLVSKPSFPQRVVSPKTPLTIKNIKLNVRSVDKGIELSWNNDTEIPANAKVLLYKSFGNEVLEQYKMIDFKQLKFLDTAIAVGNLNYAISVVNDKGIMSDLTEIVKISKTK